MCKICDKKIIKSCQFYLGMLPIELRIVMKRVKFFNHLDCLSGDLIRRVKFDDFSKFSNMLSKYKIDNFNVKWCLMLNDVLLLEADCVWGLGA